THQSPEEQHMLCTRIYLMLKMRVTISLDSMSATDILLYYTTMQTEHSKKWTQRRKRNSSSFSRKSMASTRTRPNEILDYFYSCSSNKDSCFPILPRLYLSFVIGCNYILLTPVQADYLVYIYLLNFFSGTCRAYSVVSASFSFLKINMEAN
ncbi:hypothetical protein NDU88_002117, partial [Pleurodeles waltl]